MRRLYWAIKVMHGYIGVYWFDHSYNRPHFAGGKTAMVQPRAQARRHLKMVKPHFDEAKVVRVEIVEAK